MLSGTLVPSAGSMKFAGAELAGLAPHRIINLGIGRTFQIPRPFHRLTMFENVALAGYFGQGRNSRAQAEEAAERALATVGLPTDRTASVDGLGAAGLKKLELAKALATAPKLCCSPTKVSAGSTRPRWIRRLTCCGRFATSLALPLSGSSTSWAC